MHRTIEISVPAQATDELLAGLEDLEHVIGLSVERDASVKPPGDVVTVHVLNRGSDAVMDLAGQAARQGSTSVVTAELSAITDPEHQHLVDRDVDEALWEEAETGLRHQGRITVNFLALMALGGAVATIGLVSDPVAMAVAIVASSVIAPGFEPLAKIAMGLVLRRGSVVQRGVVSTLAGYTALVVEGT